MEGKEEVEVEVGEVGEVKNGDVWLEWIMMLAYYMCLMGWDVM